MMLINGKHRFLLCVFASLCSMATAQNPHAPTQEAMKLPECIKSHGDDSLLTRHHMAYFQENFRQAKYAEAYVNWSYVFNHAPCSYKSIYQRGPQILAYMMEHTTDSARRLQLMDTLFMIFPKRMKYFGEEALINGYLAYYTSKYKPFELEAIMKGYAFYIEHYEGRKDEHYFMDFMRNTVLAYQNTLIDQEVLCGVYLRLKELAQAEHQAAKKDDEGYSSWNPVLLYLDELLKDRVKCSADHTLTEYARYYA